MRSRSAGVIASQNARSMIARSVTVVVDELSIPVIHLDDLIANERASGRPQDLADVAVLEQIRRGD